MVQASPRNSGLRERLLTHRLRGFSAMEGSLQGLESALEEGVAWVEIDTRMTADHRALVFHDTRLDGLTTAKGRVSSYSISVSGPPRYRNARDVEVPTLDSFMKVFADRRKGTRLMLDLKDPGSEQRHCDLVRHYGLQNEVMMISWAPEILLNLHEIEPDLRLGFSHIPITRWAGVINTFTKALGSGVLIRLVGRLLAALGLDHNAQDAVLFHDSHRWSQNTDRSSCGGFPIHLVRGLPRGEVGDALRTTGGGVGTPAAFLTAGYVHNAHQEGLSVFTYSIDSRDRAEKAFEATGVDVIFTNNAELIRDCRRDANS